MNSTKLFFPIFFSGFMTLFILGFGSVFFLIGCNSLRFSYHSITSLEWQGIDTVVLRSLRIDPPEFYPIYEKVAKEALRYSLFKNGQKLILDYASVSTPTNMEEVIKIPLTQNKDSFSEFLDEYSGMVVEMEEVDPQSPLPNSPRLNSTTLSKFNTNVLGTNLLFSDLFLIFSRMDNPSELKSYYSLTAGTTLYQVTNDLEEVPRFVIISEGRVYAEEREFIEFSFIQEIIDLLILELAKNTQVSYEK